MGGAVSCLVDSHARAMGLHPCGSDASRDRTFQGLRAKKQSFRALQLSFNGYRYAQSTLLFTNPALWRTRVFATYTKAISKTANNSMTASPAKTCLIQNIHLRNLCRTEFRS